MSWPTPQEYNEAIQNPRTAFADPELKAGQPVLTPLGLPRPITGGFASVYQLVCPQQRTYAVRCFLREFGDQQERYAAISAHLATTRLPYMVNFAFLPEGIRVAGRWYPALKMEWVDGASLHTYVERNLRHPQKLLGLAEQWVEMVQTLHQAGIAHGDLQHGNVIVVKDQLRLIDYDGMFVPRLVGRRSHEIGHRNYQHPARSEAYFASDMDHFSAWIVYISLLALASEPQLWADFQGGDECLILRREDFDRPATSLLLQRLATMPDLRVAALVDLLRAMLALPPEQAPPMAQAATLSRADWVRDHLNVQAAAPGQPSWQPASSQPAQPPPFLRRLPRQRPAIAAASSAAAVGATAAIPAPAEWLADHLPVRRGLPMIDFAGDLWRPRWITAGALTAAVLTWGAALGAGLGLTAPAVVTLLAMLATLGVLIGAYSRDPSVEQMWRTQAEIRQTRAHVRKVHKQLRGLEQALSQVDVQRTRQEERLDQQGARLQQDEQHEVQRLNARLQTQLAQLVQREQEVRQRESAEVTAAEQRYAGQISAHDAQLQRLAQGEAAELAQTLAKRQQQFVQSFLQRQLLAEATIPNIGGTLKQRLQEQGIQRAADIELRRLAAVAGIGEGRAQALVEWRLHVEQQAQRAAPQHLSVLDETLIRAKYLGRRIGAERDLVRARQQQARQVSEIRQRYAERRNAQGGRKQALHKEHQERLDALYKRSAQRRARLQVDRQQVQANADAQRQQVRQRQVGVEQEQDRLVADLRRLEARLAQAERLGFGDYIRRVLWP